ncbi:hypothetical protein [Amycolatopsis minnesotensis]|uniref:Uncharacterized protein n=1 Tax=Amycolatopsis minnesotensis TaxID=337894 RepID=A0ABP5DU99_9PSEU
MPDDPTTHGGGAKGAPLPAPVYPVPAPEDDPRFTFGLTLQVAEVLEAHGYPRPTALDFVDLQQALFRFLYTTRSR